MSAINIDYQPDSVKRIGYEISNSTVKELEGLKLTGNITPPNWYKTITFSNGKADLTAITILSDFVYWFRPIEARDEQTGRLLAPRQKFRADKLHRTYETIAEQFGLTERQVRDACTRLKILGFITIELRDIKIGEHTLRNCTFFDLCWHKIMEVSRFSPTVGRGTSHIVTQDVSRSNVTPLTLEREYTKISSETTSEIQTNRSYDLLGEPTAHQPALFITSRQEEQTDQKLVTEKDSAHPAIQAVRAIIRRYPNKLLHSEIIKTVGEEPDNQKMLDCYKEWIARGFNPQSLIWLLEWYKEGIPDRPAPFSSGKNRPQLAAQAQAQSRPSYFTGALEQCIKHYEEKKAYFKSIGKWEE